ncbi:hypothetical protein BGZ83_011945 [Gryganskiella cystojenkinii]|nr:hypothetical protein BGZ83_011945 [Gryganskiella cystojenkinii]
MFASSGLFAALPCPFQPSCPRESYCIYSHQPVASESTPSSSSSSTARSKPQRTTSTDQQARERNPAAAAAQQRDRPTAPSKTGSSSSVSSSSSTTSSKRPAAQEPTLPPRQSQVAAMEAAKRRRQTYDTIEPTSASSSLSSSTSAVLMSRPDVGKASLKKAPLTTGGPTGPPVLKIEILAHSKPQFRQTVATQFYNEFKRIYGPLTELGPLATAHAAEQEKAVHSKTNAGSYRGQAATVLQRLKKRPVAVDNEDVGIDGVWAERPPAPPPAQELRASETGTESNAIDAENPNQKD